MNWKLKATIERCKLSYIENESTIELPDPNLWTTIQLRDYPLLDTINNNLSATPPMNPDNYQFRLPTSNYDNYLMWGEPTNRSDSNAGFWSGPFFQEILRNDANRSLL